MSAGRVFDSEANRVIAQAKADALAKRTLTVLRPMEALVLT